MEIFGITGSIATGKSTVTNYLRDKGYLVVDSDKLAYDALTIDQDCINKTKTRFNLPEGKIDRKKLGTIIFNDKEAKADLEKIIHPYVISRIKKEIEDNRDLKYIFLDIPLLYESKLEYLCDKVIVVYLSLEDELKRLMERDQIDKEYAKLIIANQMSIETKKEKADIILDNSGSLENLYKQIEELLKGR